MSRLLKLALGTAITVASATLATAQTTTSETPSEATQAPSAAGLKAWEGIHEVFSHPRCANCHTPDERPRWSGPHYKAKFKNHAMNVQRGEDGMGNTGLRCSTCHGETNSAKLHGPPGAPHWATAPIEMKWFAQSSKAICEQVKDPARNGDKTLEEVAVHVRDDKLVGWGWAPGPGREPAPGSAQATYELLQTWIAEGAPCPG